MAVYITVAFVIFIASMILQHAFLAGRIIFTIFVSIAVAIIGAGWKAYDTEIQRNALRDMVKDVNAKEVSPEERLSDNVYHYDSKDHVFELAEKFEARQQEKKTEIDEKAEEKGPLRSFIGQGISVNGKRLD